MGKKNKNKNKKQPQEELVPASTEEQKKEVTPAAQQQKQETAEEEVQKTPEERTAEFKESSLKVHNQFVDKFKREEEELNMDPEVEDKQKQLAKREAEEMKKLEKIIKKEQNDFEDVSSTGSTNVKLAYTRLTKTITNMKKVAKQYTQIKEESDKFQYQITQSKEKLQGSLRKKALLSSICDQLMQNNFDLYLKHEQMLDDENAKRKELMEQFQTRMETMRVEIEGNKEKRQAEFDKNTAIRQKIQKAIDAYKEKEEAYKSKLEVYNQSINKVQSDLQEELKTGNLGKTLKSLDKEKEKYEQTQGKIKTWSNEIQDFAKKFDSVKEEIEGSNKKYENFKIQIETKKQQIQLLETQIENCKLLGSVREKTKEEVVSEKDLLGKQISTLSNLQSALEQQLSAL